MKNKKVVKRKTSNYNKPVNKPKLQISFYEVKTCSRTFYVCNKTDIYSNLHEDEYSFEVSYVEYIGFFQGKDDVIRVSKNHSITYITVVDLESCALYYKYMYNEVEKTGWKLLRNYSIQNYYDEFKKHGIKLKNDVYARENNFRQEVNKQINNFRNIS